MIQIIIKKSYHHWLCLNVKRIYNDLILKLKDYNLIYFIFNYFMPYFINFTFMKASKAKKVTFILFINQYITEVIIWWNLYENG